MKAGVRAWRGHRAPGLVLGLCGAVFLAAALSQAESVPLPASSNTITVTLEYQEAEEALTSWSLSVTAQSAAFQKEPDLSPSGVRRGRLDLSVIGWQPLACIWDSGKGKLHLDLNRNEDLTDDTNGVFTATGKSRDARYQDFAGVGLTLNTKAGPYPLLLNLNLRYYTRMYASASLRSFYAGKVMLQGREWQLGVVDKPYGTPGSLQDASLLLRPWEARDKPFNVDSGMMDAFAFPTNLFFQARAYRVEGLCLHETNQVRYRVQLTERSVSRGDLRFTGQFIRRAILKDGPWTVVLDAPAGMVKVPVGTYGAYQIQVQKGDAGAGLDVWPADRGINKKITVAEGAAATLAAGGPLTNSVVVTRQGNNLWFSYRLVGVGGEQYRLLQQDRSKPPRFAVYKGDRQLASGKFEFG